MVFGFCQFIASHDTLIVQYTFLYQFRPSRLYGKIILGECHLRFTRVSVLGNKIAGIAR